jgi:hypothetical protein
MQPEAPARFQIYHLYTMSTETAAFRRFRVIREEVARTPRTTVDVEVAGHFLGVVEVDEHNISLRE